MKLDNQISAVITGGASGLGEGTARLMAAKGVRVGIFDMNAERGETIAGEIGGVFAKVDVSNEDSVMAGFDKVRAINGPERVLVNCAGIAGGMKTAARDRMSGDIRPHSIDFFAKVLNVNLLGSFICLSKSAASMMALEPMQPDNERGVIINTASVAAQDGQIGQVAYAASKGGIVSMTLPITRDLAREGIRCNTILPGFFETPIYEQMKPEVKEALRAYVQFPHRFGSTLEYAHLVASLCEQVYINGASIRADAGARMPPR